MKQRMYLGRYSMTKGISVYDFEDGCLTEQGQSDFVCNPSYLHQHGDVLYAVLETVEYCGENGGGVAAFRINGSRLELLNTGNTFGRHPCQLITDRDRQYLFAANYTEGSLSCFRLDSDGSIGELILHKRHSGSGADREKQAHVHFAAFTPDGDDLCVVDLGLDRIFGYEITGLSGEEFLKPAFEIGFAPGTGPRHLVFSPDGAFAYVIGELNSTVTVLAYQRGQGFQKIQTISTLPEDCQQDSSGAAIRISGDGRFLYASNRGDNSIAVFQIADKTGRLEMLQRIDCGGKIPRDINLDPTGRYLLSANQDSDNVVIFHRNSETGLLTQSGQLQQLETPVCILFA